ncbi:MAG: hypothetical protein CFE33_01795 [Pseudorhodobacter sp. PARRP1]|nr:MAG: hypothetical protein CFE33_01795 [Pseudorhodobacter sp. PARRP1]
MIRMMRQFAQTLTLLLFAAALSVLGYGHQMPLHDPVDLSAYAMPDGTLPELCHDAGSAEHGQKGQPPCPLCRIIAALELPPVVTLPPLHLDPVAVVWRDAALTDAKSHQSRAPPARGPPATLI